MNQDLEWTRKRRVIYLSLHVSIHLYLYLSIYPSIYPLTCLSTRFYISTYLHLPTTVSSKAKIKLSVKYNPFKLSWFCRGNHYQSFFFLLSGCPYSCSIHKICTTHWGPLIPWDCSVSFQVWFVCSCSFSQFGKKQWRSSINDWWVALSKSFSSKEIELTFHMCLGEEFYKQHLLVMLM